MSLNNKPLDSLTEVVLQSLLDNAVPEGKTIDYKRDPVGGSDGDKKEFLYDVSSFANASGGHLIFGIDEAGGVPTAICGSGISDVDAEKLRMENIIQAGIAPRIPGVGIHAIPLQNKQSAIVLRIPRSWAAPHMVTFKDASRFYSRNSAGKRLLDVGEIRTAFLLSESAGERIRNFRRDRLSMITAQETPVPLDRESAWVLHIIPVAAFDPASQFDVVSLFDNFPLPPSGAGSRRLNFDGLLTFDNYGQEGAYSYLQIFRNGIIEAVSVEHTSSDQTIGGYLNPRYEWAVLEELRRLLSIQKIIGVEPPLFAMLTFVGVRGYRMVGQSGRQLIGNSIDRDVLILNEIMIEDFGTNLATAMKPAFDTVWNATGLRRSQNYDQDGNWTGGRR